MQIISGSVLSYFIIAGSSILRIGGAIGLLALAVALPQAIWSISATSFSCVYIMFAALVGCGTATDPNNAKKFASILDAILLALVMYYMFFIIFYSLPGLQYAIFIGFLPIIDGFLIEKMPTANHF